MAKNQQENNIRVAKGEQPVSDEEVLKAFRPLPVPSRLNSMIVSGQINTYSQHISQFCSQSLAKLYMTQSLQAAKTQPQNNWIRSTLLTTWITNEKEKLKKGKKK